MPRLGCPRNEIKIFSVRTETNRNKICFGCVSVCFVKPKTKIFGLFRCFEPISKQPKQTELFRIKPKQTETSLNFLKNAKIWSLSNLFGWSSVCFGSIIIWNNWKQSSSLIWCDSAWFVRPPYENMTLVIFSGHPSPLSYILHCILASPLGHLTSTHGLKPVWMVVLYFLNTCKRQAQMKYS
jgi:hypothetical protein